MYNKSEGVMFWPKFNGLSLRLYIDSEAGWLLKLVVRQQMPFYLKLRP